jgi:hypothetical protein
LAHERVSKYGNLLKQSPTHNAVPDAIMQISQPRLGYRTGVQQYTAAFARQVPRSDCFRLVTPSISCLSSTLHLAVSSPILLNRQIQPDPPRRQSHPLLLVHAHARVVSFEKRVVHALRA